MKLIPRAQLLTMPAGMLFTHATDNRPILLQVKGETAGESFYYSQLWTPDLTLPAPETNPELLLSDILPMARMQQLDEPGIAPSKDLYWVVDPDDFEEIAQLIDRSFTVYHRSAKTRAGRVREANPQNIHVDEFVDRVPYFFDVDGELVEQMKYVHFKLMYFRFPSSYIGIYRKFIGDKALYLDYEGKTWKVTGASRFGHLLLSSDLQKPEGEGYDHTAMLNFSTMSNFRSHIDYDTTVQPEKELAAPQAQGKPFAEFFAELDRQFQGLDADRGFENLSTLWTFFTADCTEDQAAFIRDHSVQFWATYETTPYGKLARLYLMFSEVGVDPDLIFDNYVNVEPSAALWARTFPQWGERSLSILRTGPSGLRDYGLFLGSRYTGEREGTFVMKP